MTVIGHNLIRKVETFDGYEILAHPLPGRENRVFHPTEPDDFGSVTYASYDLMIARPTGIGKRGRLAILMHHGVIWTVCADRKIVVGSAMDAHGRQ